VVNFIWENIFRKASEAKSITNILRENILFQDLSSRELRFVENIVHERHYQAGEPIFHQGELGVGMYIIVKGSVDILVKDLEVEDDGPAVVTRLQEKDFFGETSLVEEDGRRTATAISSSDSTLIGFFKADLMEILERNPSTGVKIVFNLAAVIGQRLKETTEKISLLKSNLRLLNEVRGKESQNEPQK
jgi:CRP-like cAMP-binding protein